MKPILIANWKMNPSSRKEALNLAKKIKKEISKNRGQEIEVLLAPPTIYLSEVKEIIDNSKIGLAAQDTFYSSEGEQTGAISPKMLSDLGVNYVIVGHSEVRARGETSETVAFKAKAVVEEKMKAIICVGESERDSQGKFLESLERQILNSISEIKKQFLSKIIIAYEPIWAVGKGKKVIEPQELHSMSIFITKVLVSKFGRQIGQSIKIIYGGSIDCENVAELYKEGRVSGFLVGRASLNEFVFSKIASTLVK